MARLSVSLLTFLSVLVTTEAFDKYADALAKYAKWQEKYGVPTQLRRDERNTQVERVGEKNTIFLPHRPQKQTGRQFQTGAISHRTNLLGFESDLETPAVVRGPRGNSDNNQVGLGGAEYVSRHGTPIYILRKQNPLYGRRKRDTDSALRAVRQGWTLLDPNTGRPLGQSGQHAVSAIAPVLRLTRNPETQLQNIAEFPADPAAVSEYIGGGEYISSEEAQPLYDYQYSRRNPYGGRRRREAGRILSRVPRSPQRGWVLLDPSTGRPIEQEDTEYPPNLRTARKLSAVSPDRPASLRTFQNSAGETQPIYKYYKKYPFGYSG